MDRAAFYSALRTSSSRLFGSKLTGDVVRGIEGILDAFDQIGDGKDETLGYALATAYKETGRRMVPVREGFASTDAGARAAVRALARKRGPESAVAIYSKPTGPYGHVYYGRGHVQLTWIDGYQRSSADAGVDLVANPDAMLDPRISARILIRGLIDGRWNRLGKGVAAYLPGDPVQCRRTVNVLDCAEEIAGYYRLFLAAIQAAGGAARPDPAKAAPAGWLGGLAG